MLVYLFQRQANIRFTRLILNEYLQLHFEWQMASEPAYLNVIAGESGRSIAD